MAIDTLSKIAGSSQSDSARVSAAQALLDRAYGKPAQIVNANVDATLNITLVKY
jgi:hypothetical protein